jgi:hypothetical protein
VGIVYRQLVRLVGIFIQYDISNGILLGGRGFLRSFRIYFPFTILLLLYSFYYSPFTTLLLLYFRFTIFLYYRTLGDNVLGGGGIW